jgi:hypothetical protein
MENGKRRRDDEKDDIQKPKEVAKEPRQNKFLKIYFGDKNCFLNVNADFYCSISSQFNFCKSLPDWEVIISLECEPGDREILREVFIFHLTGRVNPFKLKKMVQIANLLKMDGIAMKLNYLMNCFEGRRKL